MKRSWLALALLLSLSACIRTHTTDLAVPAPGARTQVAGASGIGVKVSVSDERLDKGNIGTLKAVTDPKSRWVVVPRQSIEDVISRGVEEEFKARGFRIADGPAFLLVDIRKADSSALWSLFRTNVTGEVELSARVIDSDGKIAYANAYELSERAVNKVFIGNHDESKVVLEKVLAATIATMADDGRLIRALIEAKDRH